MYDLLCNYICISDGVFPPDYNKYECPDYQGRPAHLYLELGILDIDRIDEGRMEFSLQTYIKERWTDGRLNLSAFSGERGRAFPQTLVQDLWVPDLVFDNAKSGVLFGLTLPNTHVKVEKDGRLGRTSRYNMVISCQMNFLYYPMDTQSCFIKMCLLSNPDFKVTLHWFGEEDSKKKKSSQPIRFMNDIQALKYRLETPKPHKTQEQWSSGNYTYLYANFTFVRLISGSLLNVYLPSTLIVCFSWLSFWLEVTAVPARVTLGATSLLTLVTQMVQARQGLPPISYMTAMDIWLFACLLTVFGSLLAFAFTYHIHIMQKKNATHTTSCQCSKSAPTESTCDLIVRRTLRPATSNQIATKNYNVETTAKTSWEQLRVIPLDKYFRIAFPLTFTTFAIIYWSFYLSCT
ncbi:hypothetical protein JTE90_025817 [Oedothorax gibbosus]|uniref:Glutamate-gated chloride channel n=1 Tax=Oedothorax gibbosus TaxID=931172 RepID=A0AAV6UVE0_9ARAC|nr:hypothetical protein JTE90_025817 [Oedothorax gibbosus]